MTKNSINLIGFILISLLATSATVRGQQTGTHKHDVGSGFFTINGQQADPYPITQSSLSNFLLPDFASPTSFLINQTIEIEIDQKIFQTPFIVSHNSTFPDAKFIWKFGDGRTAFGGKNTHAYARPGSYILSVYVDSKRLDAPQLVKTVLLNVLPYKAYKLPRAVLMVNGQLIRDQFLGTVNASFKNEVQLQGTHSVAGSSKIAHYFWDLSDKTSGQGPILGHQYSLASFNAVPILRVTDSLGFISDASVQILNLETRGSRENAFACPLCI